MPYNEEYCLMGCDALKSGRYLPPFRRNVLADLQGLFYIPKMEATRNIGKQLLDYMP
jgi:hypothetical protein